jgi:predicted DsbA family dithiol-disulfide isomerase
MHDALFEGGGKLNGKDFTRYAEKIGMDDFPFQQCMASDRHDKDIERDIADAGKASINGTPGFVLGKNIALSMPRFSFTWKSRWEMNRF